jgi:hypothetical protein
MSLRRKVQRDQLKAARKVGRAVASVRRQMARASDPDAAATVLQTARGAAIERMLRRLAPGDVERLTHAVGTMVGRRLER